MFQAFDFRNALKYHEISIKTPTAPRLGKSHKRDIMPEKTRLPYKTVLLTAIVTMALTICVMVVLDRGAPTASAVGTADSTATVKDDESDDDIIYVSGMHPWIVSDEPGQ